jgi:hypothetical protein
VCKRIACDVEPIVHQLCPICHHSSCWGALGALLANAALLIAPTRLRRGPTTHVCRSDGGAHCSVELLCPLDFSLRKLLGRSSFVSGTSTLSFRQIAGVPTSLTRRRYGLVEQEPVQFLMWVTSYSYSNTAPVHQYTCLIGTGCRETDVNRLRQQFLCRSSEQLWQSRKCGVCTLRARMAPNVSPTGSILLRRKFCATLISNCRAAYPQVLKSATRNSTLVASQPLSSKHSRATRAGQARSGALVSSSHVHACIAVSSAVAA